MEKPRDGNAFGAALAAHLANEVVEVWPENWLAFTLFTRLGTDWRVGPNGAIGIDSNVLFRRLDRMGLSPAEYDQLDHDIHVMELAALAAIRETP